MGSNIARKQNIFLKISVSLSEKKKTKQKTTVPLLFLKHHQLCSFSDQNIFNVKQ